MKYWLPKSFKSAEHNSLGTSSEVMWGEKRGLGKKKGGGACRLCFDAAHPGIMIYLVKSLTLTSEH